MAREPTATRNRRDVAARLLLQCPEVTFFERSLRVDEAEVDVNGAARHARARIFDGRIDHLKNIVTPVVDSENDARHVRQLAYVPRPIVTLETCREEVNEPIGGGCAARA